MIRELHTDDLPALADLMERFHAEASLPGEFDRGYLADYIAALLAGGLPAVLIGAFTDGAKRPAGAIGGVLTPSMYAREQVASEIFWYVAPEARRGMAGLRLIEAFERWARKQGAASVVMMHLDSPQAGKLDKLYTRRGYRKLETNYHRRL